MLLNLSDSLQHPTRDKSRNENKKVKSFTLETPFVYWWFRKKSKKVKNNWVCNMF